jgi:hypothetical protein
MGNHRCVVDPIDVAGAPCVDDSPRGVIPSSVKTAAGTANIGTGVVSPAFRY